MASYNIKQRVQLVELIDETECSVKNAHKK